MFTLEALNARHGDALLLHYGSDDDPGLVLCDAGPSGTYSGFVKPRLDELKAARSPDEPLPIDLAMVSHLDDDHVHGVVDLFADLVETSDNQEALPWVVRELWINQFDDLVGNAADELRKALEATPSGGGPPPVAPQSRAVVASVPQGQSVRDAARRLNVDVNGAPFHGLVVAPAGSVDVDLGRDLVVTVVAPDTTLVENLQKAWDAVIRKKAEEAEEPTAEVAEFLDTSVYNLSSIVALARTSDRSMLLTGDARGDHILESLESAGLLEGGRLHVDLFKLPHHGSVRNVAAEFFEAITADHYVISADGRDGNPEVETLQMLSASRPDDEFTVYVTNSIPHVDEFFAQERDAGRSYEVVIRPDDEPSLVIDVTA